MTTTQIVESGDQKGEVKSVGGVQYIKAYFASGFTQYTPYVLDQGATLFNPTASAPATNAVANSRVVVPQGDTTTVAGWYWAAFQGEVSAMVDGTTDIVDGAYIEVINAGVAFILDHATVATSSGCAVCQAAVTSSTAAATSVYLTGNWVVIAAS